MQQIKRILGANPAGAEIESLWLEYEEGATKEAQLVKDFDKVSSKKFLCRMVFLADCRTDLLLESLSKT